MNAHSQMWNTHECVKALKTLDATGWHNVVAIHPTTGAIEAKTFSPGSWDQIYQWIEKRQGRFGLYYSVNEPAPGAPDRKLSKAHIANARALHVDVDPPKMAGQGPDELEAARADIRETFVNEVQSHDENFPTIIVDSGGGYQAVWSLDEKRSASQWGSVIEAQNRGLAEKFAGDFAATDISRILRLPGTVNLPNALKQSRGRVAAKAVALDLIESTVSLDEMAAWVPPVAAPRQSPSLSDRVRIDVAVDTDAVEEATASGIPGELREKFDRQREADERLGRLWEGDKTAVGGADTSGSAFLWALAMRLRRSGNFSPTEFGQIAVNWDYGPEHIDERQLARAWGRNNAAAAQEEFDEVFSLPFKWAERREASSIPKRRFVIGRLAARNYLTALISPPGVGKTTFLLMVAVAVVTGRSDITGFKVHERTRVMLWNQEDEADELDRRLLAILEAFNLTWADLEIGGKPGLLLGSGVERPFLVAKRESDVIKRSPDASYVESLIKDNEIGLAIFDPFVEMHPANENDNVEVAAVARIFRQIAVRGECAVVVAHHTRKPPNAANREKYAGNMDAGRGAGSLNGVARMVATLYTLDAATAKRYGIQESEHKRYVRLDDGKANMSLISDTPTIFKREGVTIGGFGGEEVGVLRPVNLGRVKSPAESKADDDAAVRDAMRGMLRAVTDRSLPVADVVANLIDGGTIEMVSSDTLRKRIETLCRPSLRYDNGDQITRSTRAVKGKNGRPAFLTLEIAETRK
jgi:hypothetical protein